MIASFLYSKRCRLYFKIIDLKEILLYKESKGEKMNFYEKMLIKVLEKSMSAQDSEILKKLKSGIDLSAKDKKELEELIDSL